MNLMWLEDEEEKAAGRSRLYVSQMEMVGSSFCKLHICLHDSHALSVLDAISLQEGGDINGQWGDWGGWVGEIY